MKFNPDKDFTKHRAMSGGIYFVQDGEKFSAGHEHIGKAPNAEKPEPKKKKAKKAVKKEPTVRERAAAKIAAKKGGLDGFKKADNPDAIDSMLAENAASKKAEELAE